jgi:hypothetical protein
MNWLYLSQRAVVRTQERHPNPLKPVPSVERNAAMPKVQLSTIMIECRNIMWLHIPLRSFDWNFAQQTPQRHLPGEISTPPPVGRSA